MSDTMQPTLISSDRLAFWSQEEALWNISKGEAGHQSVAASSQNKEGRSGLEKEEDQHCLENSERDKET